MPSEQDELVSYLGGHSVSCGQCAYDLRGLESACCPECGFENDVQSIEAMLVAQEVHEYSWHQTMKWFRRCQLVLTMALALDIVITKYLLLGLSVANRGKVMLVMAVLIVFNEWFRHWIRVGYRKDSIAFRRVVWRAEMYVYIITGAATLLVFAAVLRYLVV